MLKPHLFLIWLSVRPLPTSLAILLHLFVRFPNWACFMETGNHRGRSSAKRECGAARRDAESASIQWL